MLMNRVLPVLLPSILFVSASLARDYYVATDGNDTNAGTMGKPFATLEKARDTIRQSKARALSAGGITVYVRHGSYFRTQAFSLTDQDSGEQGKPITYRAYPGEEVRLIGGRAVPVSAFSLVAPADAVWSRLDPSAQGKCLKANLGPLGITQYGEALQMELSVGGELLPLARWPNEGFVRTTSAENNITFGYDDPRPERWLAAPDAYAMGYWYHGWANRVEKIASIDPANKKITLAKAPGYGIAAKKPYYVLNLLEEIDRPGEWYLDRQAGILYLWPPAGFGRGEALLSFLHEPLVSLKGTSFLRLEGLTLEMGAANGVEISGHDNAVVNCIIRNIRKDGVIVSGDRNGVAQCEISGIGETGVSLSGGDRYKLVAGANSVRNCRIHNFGRWERTYAPAIRINGVAQIAANNLLYDAPHSAILFGGNDHVIELNEIHDVCYEVDDAGSVYCGRDWGLQGNVIRHNFFHHIKSSLPGSNGVHAVYLDDCASGIIVFGNTFYEISGRAIMCGGGRDNTIENNIIAKCGAAHFTDRRGKVWIDKDSGWRLLDKIKKYNYTEPPWSTRYPRLAHLLDNGYEQAKEPEGCVIRANLGWQNKRWLQESSLGAAGGFKFYTVENNIEDQDPHFVDEQNLNLALRDDSPAYSLRGFQRIPFDSIGPGANGFRQDVWPLAKRASFIDDPNVLAQGTVVEETATAQPRHIFRKISRSEEHSLGSDSTMTFRISGDHVLQPIQGGRWRLGGTLEVKFAGRYEPHEASVFPLFESARSLQGRFDRVVVPPGWKYQLDHNETAGTVVLRDMHPDRAPAFPGAEGFGKYTMGGRGGRVYEVTNLNDSGPGSLREACGAQGPRIVVFRVSGTIPLKSKLRIRNPYITIAGQTAPGDGICVKGYQTEFEADQVIIRYMRFRLGDENRQESDSFGGQGQYAIIDHCSASWSVDETFSINKASNLTAQWCMITESLYDSLHKKGKHGYGGLWGGPGGSWHHNLLAHHSSRNPRASGNKESGLMDFRNNVIYNWGFNSSYGGEGWPRNWINNYYKYGPATRENVRHRIFIQQDPRSQAYTQGNFVWGFPAISADNWKGGIDFQMDRGASEATLRVDQPFVVAPVRTQEATEAYELVLKHAGASLVRDAVDARIIEEIRAGTAHYGETWGGGGKGIINSQKAVGGWPVLESTTPPTDSDHDGMPDGWEHAHGLDPQDPRDGPQDRDGDGYTNVEEYLNSLVPSIY
jgi:hypothetical protein